MAILDSDDFLGIDPAELSFAIRSSGTHPIVLGNDIRGALHSILDSDKRLTDITGQRLEEGMLVYLKVGYEVTEDLIDYTYNSNTYYTYRVQTGDEGRTDANAGSLPNSNINWGKSAIEADEGKVFLQVDSDLPTVTGTYTLDYNAGTQTFKIVSHDSEHDSDVALADAVVWASVGRAGPNEISYESDVIQGHAIADDQIVANHLEDTFLETLIKRNEVIGIIESDGVNTRADRLRDLEIPIGMPSDNYVLTYVAADSELQWRPRDDVSVGTVRGHFVNSGDIEVQGAVDDSDSDLDSEIQLVLRDQFATNPIAVQGSSTKIPVIKVNAKGLVESLTESDIALAVDSDTVTYNGATFVRYKDSEARATIDTILSVDSDTVTYNGATFVRYRDSEARATIDTILDVDSNSVTYNGTVFTKYTDAQARTAVGIVTGDITNSRQLIFTKSGSTRTLDEFRDSENSGTSKIRTTSFVTDSGEGTVKLTLVLVEFMPASISTDGLGGGTGSSSQLDWDVSAIGTGFDDPGVGIEVDIDGDPQLTDSEDLYISSIATITATAGFASNISSFSLTNGGGDPAADNTNYQLRAVVTASARIQPTIADESSTTGGTASGTVTLNQKTATTSATAYTAQTGNDLAWDLTWKNVGVNPGMTLNGYNVVTGETFLNTHTYSDINYSTSPTGLSSTTSTAATGVAVSVVNPDTDYVTLSTASSNNGVISGLIEFENPVDIETARSLTVNMVTSFTRPAAVTTNGLYSISVTSPITLGEPTFTYPRFFIITERAANPTIANIIDDSATTGIGINIAATDSAVTDDIGPLGNTWVGTGSNGSIIITSGQAASTVWFAIPTSDPDTVTQPTNFERSVAGTFSAYNNVHGLRGLRPTAVTLDLIPDDVTGFNTSYTGQEYRFYGIDLGSGDTEIRIF